jgi:hypothetical protein
MERFPVELLYLLGFVAIILFNFIAQRAARQRQQQEEARAPVPSAPPPIEEELSEDVWGRTPTRPPPTPVLAPPPALPPARVQPPVTRRVHPVRALLKDTRELRRAVILTMVLGPCRAQEPPER